MKRLKELYRRWRAGEEIEFRATIPIFIFVGVLIFAAIALYGLIREYLINQ